MLATVLGGWRVGRCRDRETLVLDGYLAVHHNTTILLLVVDMSSRQGGKLKPLKARKSYTQLSDIH